MSTETARATPFASPRPGLAKGLGICHVVVSALILAGVIAEVLWLFSIVSLRGLGGAPGGPPGQPNPMMGMDHPLFLRFTLIDAVTALAVNFAMMASGIGLINLRRWGARLWAWLAWIKIGRLVLLWGAYVVVVSPSLSENMARSVSVMMPPGRGPSIGDLTRVYAIMNLIMAAAVIALGSIYPAVTLWVQGRPGVKAALAANPPTEPDLP